jgi:hypothetical protein
LQHLLIYCGQQIVDSLHNSVERRPIGIEHTSRVAFVELRAHTLTGVVPREIEGMILSGELAPGERLNEKLLADKLIVSRGPVREACRVLAKMRPVCLVPIAACLSINYRRPTRSRCTTCVLA